MLALISLLLLSVLGVRSACVTTCAGITSHTVEVANGTHDFTTASGVQQCSWASMDLSESDSTTFGFPIADSLWSLSHTFTDSSIRFLAYDNRTASAIVKISIEEQGSVHACPDDVNGTFTVDNETSVQWEIPSTVGGEYFSTPDLSSRLPATSTIITNLSAGIPVALSPGPTTDLPDSAM